MVLVPRLNSYWFQQHLTRTKYFLVLGTLYAPPKSFPEIYNSFSENLELFAEQYPLSYICILGDFNLPHCIWYDSDYASTANPSQPSSGAEQNSIQIISNIGSFLNLFQINYIVNNETPFLILYQYKIIQTKYLLLTMS